MCNDVVKAVQTVENFTVVPAAVSLATSLSLNPFALQPSTELLEKAQARLAELQVDATTCKIFGGDSQSGDSGVLYFMQR